MRPIRIWFGNPSVTIDEANNRPQIFGDFQDSTLVSLSLDCTHGANQEIFQIFDLVLSEKVDFSFVESL